MYVYVCFFCKCFNTPSLQKESFVHLFRSCPFTSNLLLQYLRSNRVVIPLNDTGFEDSYWYGTINQVMCKSTLLLFDCFIYCIWTFKTRKTAPTLVNLKSMIDGLLSGIFARRPHMLREFVAIPHLNYLALNLQVAG